MSLVLVTGATGFVGSAIARQLQTAGVPVRTTGRADRPAWAPPHYMPCDLVRQRSLASLVAGAGCVVHAAGLAHRFEGGRRQDEDEFFMSNVVATEALLRAAADHGAEHFVLVSSVAVYGGGRSEAVDETASCRPRGPYAVSKHDAEQCVIRLANELGIRATILRLATVFGEGDPGNVRRLMEMIERGRFVWIGSGENRKSLIYREDAARACFLAALDAPGKQVRIYNVCAPPCTVREVVQCLAAALGRRLPRLRCSASTANVLLQLAGRLRPLRAWSETQLAAIETWLRNDVFDGGRFQRDFGYQTTIQLKEGIQREVDWHRRLRSARLRAA